MCSVFFFLRKARMEQNRSIDPALKQLRRFEVLFLSLQSNLNITALTIKRPVRIFHLYKRRILLPVLGGQLY